LSAAPILGVEIDPLNVENLSALRTQSDVPIDADWESRK
jgi:hypothetical protein